MGMQTTQKFYIHIIIYKHALYKLRIQAKERSSRKENKENELRKECCNPSTASAVKRRHWIELQAGLSITNLLNVCVDLVHRFVHQEDCARKCWQILRWHDALSLGYGGQN